MPDCGTHIRPKQPPLSATSGLDAIAAGLNSIKADQRCNDAVLADPLFKSPDRVRDYRLGHSEMGAVTFLRGMAAWGEEFAGAAVALAGYRLVPLDDGDICALPVSGLLHKLIELGADGAICARDIAAMREEILAAGAVIDALRARLLGAR